MHIAAYKMVVELTIRAIEQLRNTLAAKTEVQEGGENRSYTPMDATPYYTRARNFRVRGSSYGIKALQNTLHLSENSSRWHCSRHRFKYASRVRCYSKYISQLQGPFTTAPNKFGALAAHDAIVESHGDLEQIAVS
jgi:fumarate hydratase class II